jgi:hypothetical protein
MESRCAPQVIRWYTDNLFFTDHLHDLVARVREAVVKLLKPSPERSSRLMRR